VVDPAGFRWTDAGWPGVGLSGQVIYELHLGTFTPEGTWAAASRELPALAELGATVVEVMPIADFVGRFGWGYDGVNLFAPTRLYGSPDDARRFVDRAHALGLGVILDVVYNHFGPEGNYLHLFSPAYTSERHHTEWGAAINFDGPASGPVREFFVANAGYWIDEFHVDGLRLDATHALVDDSPEHILTAIARHARRAAGDRRIILVAEDQFQQSRFARRVEDGGCGLDGLWNDDFHHSARVAATGRREGYYADYRGAPQEFISAAKRGFLYQGQLSSVQRTRRGQPTAGLTPEAFVVFLQNHDQVANSPFGERLHRLTSPSRCRALTALLLLLPATPLLFQGQEFAASSPFHYFADYEGELAQLVREGRHASLAQFASQATDAVQARLIDPISPAAFEGSKLDLGERERHADSYALHRDLLRLRRDDPVFGRPRPGAIDGAVLGPQCFALRFFGEAGADRLLLVNLGPDLHLGTLAEPLLAPPPDQQWVSMWSSEAPAYGGQGQVELSLGLPWVLSAESAMVLRPGDDVGG
jgi:maltooligosyltrehalose trehalohydrolase